MDIRSLREKYGMSRQEFSDFLGIKLRTLKSWEIGERTPPDYIVELIKRVLKNEKGSE